MPKEAILTNHGRERIKERTGVGKSDKKAQRAAKIAYERGLGRELFKGAFRKYLDENFQYYGAGNNMKVHAGMIWIFQENVLVTVKPIPARYAIRYLDYRKK